MNCLDVRSRLSEHVLSALDARDSEAVARHLEWCAGCRKEEAELREAAAVLAFSVKAAVPPSELEERVVDEIRREAERRGSGRRRRRSLAVTLLAAALAVTGLGWGTVMAGRAEKFERRADLAQQSMNDARTRFLKVLDSLPFSVPEDDTRMGSLVPRRGIQAGGAAFMLVSPDTADLVFVMVSGIDPADREVLPLRVRLRGEGEVLTVGRISRLDPSTGSGSVFAEFDRDLGEFDHVVVRDESGKAVMRGDVGTGSEFALP